MPFLLILIGAVLFVSALQNTQTQLASALEQDIPGFTKWALAVVLIGALGWIPGFRTISRWLLALVLIVIVVKNYQGVISGLTNVVPQQATAAPTPAAQYASLVGAGGSGASTALAALGIGGGSGGNIDQLDGSGLGLA